MAELKAWKCKSGHVMGQVKWKGHGESQLYLFREALDLEAVHPAEQIVLAVMEGYVTVTVTCTICEQSRMWVPGEEALVLLIQSHRQMVINQKDLEKENG